MLARSNSLRVVDLFSGCGGMSRGFEKAGFQVVAAFDNWRPAVDVYRLNFNHPIHTLDLSEPAAISEIRDYLPDVIVGGPPCQDFSIAGHRNFGGRRANLTLRFAEIVVNVRPRFFLMENVYNIQKTAILKEVLSMLSKEGYGLTHGVFDASLMNCPQRRRRYLIIGELGGTAESFRPDLASRLAGQTMTVRDYLGDRLGTDYYYMHPRSYARRAIFSIDEASSTIRGVNRPMPDSYKFHPADATTSREQVRALSAVERSWLQTFPEDFVFQGSRTVVEQMIGNAVPVEMASFVAECISERNNVGV